MSAFGGKADIAPTLLNVCFSNRPVGVKRFQTLHPFSVDVARRRPSKPIGRASTTAATALTRTPEQSISGHEGPGGDPRNPSVARRQLQRHLSGRVLLIVGILGGMLP